MSFFYDLPPTPAERDAFIETLRTANGGFAKTTLERLGVSWPPKQGWKKQLIKNGKITK